MFEDRDRAQKMWYENKDTMRQQTQPIKFMESLFYREINI